MNNRLISSKGPDFLCIGAQKAGTTWLYENLRRHPDVWLPPEKEIHYFDQHERYSHADWLTSESIRDRLFGRAFSDRNWRKRLRRTLRHPVKWRLFQHPFWWAGYFFGRYDDAWYLSRFKAPKGKITGDITPAYAILEETEIQRIKSLVPDARIIFIVRNPVDRAWSHCKMKLRRPMTQDEIISFLEGPEQRLRGDYPRTIANWTRYYDETSFLVINFDDVKARPLHVLSTVCRHIGIDPKHSNAVLAKKRIHKGRSLKCPGEIRSRLLSMYAEDIREMRPVLGAITDIWEQENEESRIAGNRTGSRGGNLSREQTTEEMA